MFDLQKFDLKFWLRKGDLRSKKFFAIRHSVYEFLFDFFSHHLSRAILCRFWDVWFPTSQGLTYTRMNLSSRGSRSWMDWFFFYHKKHLLSSNGVVWKKNTYPYVGYSMYLRPRKYVETLYYTEHCSVWSYQFYWYYRQYYGADEDFGWRFRMKISDEDFGWRFLKISFIYLCFVNLIYIIFN